MIKFYEILLDETQQVSVPVALKTAQNCLNNLTVKEYRKQSNNCQYILENLKQIVNSQEMNRLVYLIKDEQIRVENSQPHHQLFNNLFYWAAFTAVGI